MSQAAKAYSPPRPPVATAAAPTANVMLHRFLRGVVSHGASMTDEAIRTGTLRLIAAYRAQSPGLSSFMVRELETLACTVDSLGDTLEREDVLPVIAEWADDLDPAARAFAASPAPAADLLHRLWASHDGEGRPL